MARKKTTTKRKSLKPHLVATPEEGYGKQIGFIIDERFYETLKRAVAEKGTTVSQLTRTLQEAWLKKQV